MGTPYRLTRNERRVVCVHEAAHAVVHALGPRCSVYRVEVKPVGSIASLEARDHAIPAWGICFTSTMPVFGAIAWDDDTGELVAIRDWYLRELRRYEDCHPGCEKKFYQELRTHICGVLAGPIAQGIFCGDFEAGSISGGRHQVDIDNWEECQDAAIAAVACTLLPTNDEFNRLCRETERVLMEPDVWDSVIRLAKALEVAGCIKDEALEPFLPKPRPDWLRIYVLAETEKARD